MPLSPTTPSKLLPGDSSSDPSFPDPYASWLGMLFFGAVVAAIAAFTSAGWNFVQLSARVQGVPVRRTLNSVFPYVMLGMAACKWMGVWALTSSSPLVETQSGWPLAIVLSRWRGFALRLLVSASFIIMSLRLWGVIGSGLRPAFDSVRFAFVTQSSEALETILLWLHLRALAVHLGDSGLSGRSVLVLIGRGGTLVFLYVMPLGLAVAGQFPRLSWDLVNIRYCLSVLWDVIALLVLLKFANAFLRARRRDASI